MPEDPTLMVGYLQMERLFLKSFFGFLLTLFILMSTAVPSLAADASRRGVALQGDGPHYLNLGGGSFEGFDDFDDSVTAQIEWRFGRKLYFVGPLLGLMGNTDGGALAFAGVYLDAAIGPWVLSPQTGISFYEKGKSKELGGAFEFMSGLSLSYEFAGRSRLGLRYQHASNADLHNKNPGADILLLVYGIPF
jgi:hypothetical protein